MWHVTKGAVDGHVFIQVVVATLAGTHLETASNPPGIPQPSCHTIPPLGNPMAELWHPSFYKTKNVEVLVLIQLTVATSASVDFSVATLHALLSSLFS